MKSGLSRLSVCFAGGCAGGAMYCLAVWGAGQAHLTTRLGVKLAPELTDEWVMPRVLWGGLWGLLFLLPVMQRRNILLRGMLFSLAPTLAQLFYFFPQSQRGVMGLSLGQLTPLVVALAGVVWGVTAAWWVRQGGAG